MAGVRAARPGVVRAHADLCEAGLHVFALRAGILHLADARESFAAHRSRPGNACCHGACIPHGHRAARAPAREYQWVAAFSFDNFAGWQQAFSIKNFISVLDRANGLLAQMRPDFVADRGQFYLGLVTLFAVAAVFWWSRKHSEWLATRNGVLLRLFVGMTLLALWFAQGPFSVFTGVQEFLKGSPKAPDWIAALMWLMTCIPPFLIYAILPAGPRRGFLATVLILIYLFVPGFVLLEKLPMYRDIRAPWGFWEVGFFTAAVAGAIALQQLFDALIEKRDRLVVAGLLGVILLLDCLGLLFEVFRSRCASTDVLRLRPLSGLPENLAYRGPCLSDVRAILLPSHADAIGPGDQ